MKLGFDAQTFFTNLLPQHKRQPGRLSLYSWVFGELQKLYNDFNQWRTFIYKEANTTGIKISLEHILNEKINGAKIDGRPAISIQDFDDGARFISLESEDLDFVWLSTEDEAGDFMEIANKGEESTSFATDFRVYAPSACNPEHINQILEIYKLAGKTYEIIQN